MGCDEERLGVVNVRGLSVGVSLWRLCVCDLVWWLQVRMSEAGGGPGSWSADWP